MDVIRHEAVRVNGEPEAPGIDAQAIEILLPIVVITEDRAALVATRQDVVDGPLELEPWRSRQIAS
jgi:hypothetical protein